MTSNSSTGRPSAASVACCEALRIVVAPTVLRRRATPPRLLLRGGSVRRGGLALAQYELLRPSGGGIAVITFLGLQVAGAQKATALSREQQCRLRTEQRMACSVVS